MLKKTNGITLIGLVVTIIVLLILSTVAINTIFGNDSALNKANEARRKNEKSEISDVIAMAVNNIALEQGINQNEIENYYETKEKFIEYGKITENAYSIKSYSLQESIVEFKIEKVGGLGIEYEYEINIKTREINCKTEVQSEPDNVVQANINPEFYVCNEQGEELTGFDAWFDNDLSTYKSASRKSNNKMEK